MAHFHVAFPENIVRLGLCILIPSAHPDPQPVGPGLQLSFHPAEDLLYGVLLLAVTSFSLNRILLWGLSQTEVKIISEHPEEIRQAILTRMDRGVTLFFGEGGYKGEKRPVLLTVISPRELGRLKEIVLRQDPESFVIVSKAAEVCGRGFTAARRYL